MKSSPISDSWTDNEIRTKEEDGFGFLDYAEVLSGRVLEGTPPITVGLFGSWGSGKTSLMRLIEADVNATNTGVKTLWINVWQIAIGLFGSWGRGKAEAMRLLENEVKAADKRVKTIRINVWQMAFILFARWGSDKSKLMRFVEDEANAGGKRVKTLWINVWQLNNQDEVWQAFLQAIFSKVHRELSLWRRVDKRKTKKSVRYCLEERQRMIPKLNQA